MARLILVLCLIMVCGCGQMPTGPTQPDIADKQMLTQVLYGWNCYAAKKPVNAPAIPRSTDACEEYLLHSLRIWQSPTPEQFVEYCAFCPPEQCSQDPKECPDGCAFGCLADIGLGFLYFKTQQVIVVAPTSDHAGIVRHEGIHALADCLDYQNGDRWHLVNELWDEPGINSAAYYGDCSR